jgi:hypothetical protein
MPEEEAEEEAANGAMNDATSAERASGGEIIIGKQSRGVGASSGLAEPTSAPTTTAEQVIVEVSSVVTV